MDNFDFKKYLASGRIYQDHDQINEKKEDSKKGNKEEQKRLEGAIRDNRDHKFNIDKDEDEQRKKLKKLQKDAKKESGKGKKGNEDEQKRAEGAIKDAKDHKKNLDKDIKADEKKLAKLKKDFKRDVNESEDIDERKKQGYNDRDDEAIGAKDGAEKNKKVSMKGRRDMSRGMEKALGNRPDSTDSKMDEQEINEFDAGVVAVGAPIVMSVVAAGVAKMGYDAVMDLIKAKFPKEDAKYSAEEDIEVSMSEEEVSEYGKKPMYDEDDKDAMKEDARTDAEEEGYEDGFKDAKKDMKDALSKMKVSELKAKIKEDILEILSEQDEEVDVDIDVEDEVEVEAGADDIEIERPGVKAKVEVGLSPEEEIVQDSLKAAMDAADALGSQKLADQIGNTITFFTREFVVGNQSD